jgi:hypothetical protein
MSTGPDSALLNRVLIIYVAREALLRDGRVARHAARHVVVWQARRALLSELEREALWFSLRYALCSLPQSSTAAVRRPHPH